MTHLRSKIVVIGIVAAIGLTLGSCKNRTSHPENPKQKYNNPVVLQVGEEQENSGGVFDLPEIEIVPSPDQACEYTFPEQEQIIDYSVSPIGAIVAVLTERQNRHSIKFWTMGTSEIPDSFSLPEAFKSEAVVWHPKATALFVLGTENASAYVYRIEKTNKNWAIKRIFTSEQKLKNMVIGPQPFIIDYGFGGEKSRYAYRLFLGMDDGKNNYRIVSITEQGQRFYQVVGPEKTQTKGADLDAEEDPSTMKAAWALPVAFHPAGHQLIWQDKQRNFFVAKYYSKLWGGYDPIKLPLKNKEALIPTPNGLGVISWQKNTPGIEMYVISKKSSSRQLSEYNFDSAPVSVPDGKGIVGKTVKNGAHTLRYAPVNIPLPNVLNAWLFINSEAELDLFQKQYGLFRPVDHEQLYVLYETESYSDGGSIRNNPTRPYLVTTDIFWEVFAAAYHGLFIIKEKEQAIPNFWQFINEADNYFKTNRKSSKWNMVFAAIKDLKTNNTANEETLRIINGMDDISEVTHGNYAYSDLKPRGHYTSSTDMELYFRSFRYFTTILSEDSNALKEFENLPAGISRYAVSWINSYSGFIAPSRSSLVWKDIKTTVPRYSRHPKEGTAIFPLSWGFDNEIFYSTIYHQNLPENERIEGPYGKRLLPSGLDIAAVLGNKLAEDLMSDEYAKYPPLRKMIDNLRGNFKTHTNTPDFKTNLYNQWMNAMAVQWAASSSLTGTEGEAIWQAKRLQTGLATWATLRHATVLVNERNAAECGESGFEAILMKPPRGYVEPDPYTLNAITGLFREMLKTASVLKTDAADKQMVYDGLVKRLEEAIQETGAFAAIAEKERKGEKLTDKEYEKILYVARVAEHLFLVFNSLENPEYALSTPDPVSKIADVAGGGSSPLLMAAVGKPMEWDYIVPFYGRYQIVKGSIYSYYEFKSEELLNDEQWRERVDKQEVLPWLKPYILHSTSRDANTGY